MFAYVSEKNYENDGHWLMFLFSSKKAVPFLPRNGKEGSFAFFERSEIKDLDLPASDDHLIWPLYDRYGKEGFAAVRSDFTIPNKMKMKVEEAPS